MKADKSIATVSTLAIGPHPRSTPIVMIKVAPHVPFALLSLCPIPSVPGFMRALIHKIHVVAIIPLCKFRLVTKKALAEVITNTVGGDITAPHHRGHFEDTPSPSIIVATIDHLERSVLDCDVVEGPIDFLVLIDTENRQFP